MSNETRPTIPHAADDFFAFGADEDDFPDYNHQKHKRRKKERKKKEKDSQKLGRKNSLRSNSLDGSSTPISMYDSLNSKSVGSNNSFGTSNKQTSLTSSTTTNDDLIDMLGISDANAFDTIRLARERSKSIHKAAEYSDRSDCKRSIDKSDLKFMNQLGAELKTMESAKNTDILEQFAEQFQSSKLIKFKGNMVPFKMVYFSLKIVFDLPNWPSTLYVDIQMKGGVTFSKVITLVLNKMDEGGYFLPNDITENDLVVYVEELDLIFYPHLKVGVLGQRSDHKFTYTEKGDGYVLTVTLTTDNRAKEIRQLKLVERQIREEAAAPAYDDITFDGEDDSLSVIIVDPMLTKETRIPTKELTNVKELLDIYLARMGMPGGLKLELYQDGLLMQMEDEIRNLPDNEKLEAFYDKREWETLAQAAVSDDEDEFDIANFNNVGDNNSKEDGIKYFSISMKGKDGKSYQVKVHHATKIREIAEYYVKKAELSVTTPIKLLFDDEEMPMHGTVADTELEEEGDLVDVVIIG